MEKIVFGSGVRTPAVNMSSGFKFWLKKLCLFLTVVLLLLALSSPAVAAVEALLAMDNDGNYHQYGYEELAYSRVMQATGRSNGLFEDFAAKATVAFFDSVGGYLCYSAMVDHYIEAVIKREAFVLSEYIQSASAEKITTPGSVILVSVQSGSLVREKKDFTDNGQDGEDVAGRGGADGDGEADTNKPDGNDYNQSDEKGTDHSESGPQPGSGEETENSTLIVSAPTVSLSQAQDWALSNNAHQRFVNIAPIYWEYGEKTGIRPEVLYAQAAYETGFGHYNGQVPPEYNNWAGIKIATSNGDRPEDHEQFATPEDGVRGHFNHVSAYVGLNPIGTPHDRYHTVTRIAWAGTIETLEEFSQRWAPSPTYHERIVTMISEMQKF